jgi:hypothetical protein
VRLKSGLRAALLLPCVQMRPPYIDYRRTLNLLGLELKPWRCLPEIINKRNASPFSTMGGNFVPLVSAVMAGPPFGTNASQKASGR